MDEKVNMEKQVVLGGGCFWCLEAVYLRTPGILRVEPGYAGGHRSDPTYRQVCTGETGHAEVVRIHYNPDEITLSNILDLFWKAHDPTTLNRQGNDVGTQYRSILFYTSDEEKKIEEESKKEAVLNFLDPIVTEIVPLEQFYPAEDYHYDYYNQNPGNPYCIFVIRPKLQKLELE